MKTKMKKGRLLALPVAALVLSSCGSASTQPDEAALIYDAGSFSSTSFQECVEPGNRAYYGPGDQSYAYPAGQRTYAFTGDEGAESGALNVTSSDQIQLAATGVLTFTLNTDCDTLRAFHEQIGRKYEAYNVDGATSPGWSEMLDIYLGQPLQRALQVAAQAYPWQGLYSDPQTRTDFENAVRDNLPDYVSGQAETSDFFQDFGITLQRPTPPQQLIDQLRDQQIAAEQVNTVDARQAALDAELLQIQQLVALLGPDGYVNYRNLQNCQDGDEATQCIPAFTVPAGTGVTITQPAG